ncbi:hypothetical protein PROFUN_04101 [Planoprotostelium fungivorum]|uniref:Ras guanine nucleotide exchange factor n=1 Tax=Planoprotostelium fungivorum TaxID=1890364 RepID=A0A2P6NJI0_9EUKA|nr:hypothetical protein PROFUN_04101 [Planoprotostelium fungivorum]
MTSETSSIAHVKKLIGAVDELVNHVNNEGGKVTHRYDTLMKAFAADLTPELHATLSKHAYVNYIEADQEAPSSLLSSITKDYKSPSRDEDETQPTTTPICLSAHGRDASIRISGSRSCCASSQSTNDMEGQPSTGVNQSPGRTNTFVPATKPGRRRSGRFSVMEASPSMEGNESPSKRKTSISSNQSSASNDSEPNLDSASSMDSIPKYMPKLSWGNSSLASSTDGVRSPDNLSTPPSRAPSTGELWGGYGSESQDSAGSSPIYQSASSDDVTADHIARRETFRRHSTNDQWKSQTKHAAYRPRIHTTGDVVNARMMHSAVIWEDFMFVFGGIRIAPAVRWDDIKAFHFATRTWSDPVKASAVKPKERFGHTAVVYGDSMWVFGGDQEGEFTDEEQTWRPVDYSVTVNNSPIGATTSTGFMGMLTADFHVTRSLERDRGINVVERPGPRTGHSAVLWDNCMYIFGGLLPYSTTNPNESTNEMWQFNFVAKKWTRVQYLGNQSISARHFHSAVVIGDSMYIFGGKDGATKLGDFWEFKFVSRSWVQINNSLTPGPRTNHVSVVVGENIYLCGGKTDEADAKTIEVFEFDFMFRRWYKIDTKTDEGLLYMSAVSRNGNVFFFGGVVDGDPPATVNGLSYLCLGNIDYEEEIEMDEISKVNALPKNMWEGAAMKRHPQLLAVTERMRCLNRKKSFGTFAVASRTENKEVLSSREILQVVMEYLKSVKMESVVKMIQEESSVRLVERNDKEPRLTNLLRIAHRSMKGRDSIFSTNLPQALQDYDVDPEISDIDHLRHNEEVEQIQSSWDEPDEPMYIQREKTPEGKPGLIRLGTLNKLVVDLTTQTIDPHIDMEFSRMFLSVFTRFTSPATLLEKLIERYDVKEELLDDDQWEHLPGTKIRVCQVLQLWVEKFGWDFKNEALNARLRSFIEGPLSRDGNVGVVKQLKTSLNLLLKKRNTEEEMVARGITPPEVRLPKNNLIFTPEFNINSTDELELARQLTIIDFSIFAQIQPSELYRKKWLDSDQSHLSPHVTQLCQRSKDITSWVSLSIVSGDTKRQRGRTIERFVKMAENLHRLRNFHTHFAVVRGLSHESVTSLTQTIADLTPKARAELDVQIHSMGRENGFKHYNPSESVRLPNFDHVLSEISSVEESQPDDVNNLVNFSKCRLIYESVGLLQAIQARHYNLQPVTQIMRILLNLPKRMTDDDLLEMGHRAEPRRHSVSPGIDDIGGAVCGHKPRWDSANHQLLCDRDDTVKLFDPPLWCKPGRKYNVTQGYRLEAGNGCRGGVDKYPRRRIARAPPKRTRTATRAREDPLKALQTRRHRLALFDEEYIIGNLDDRHSDEEKGMKNVDLGSPNAGKELEDFAFDPETKK